MREGSFINIAQINIFSLFIKYDKNYVIRSD